MCPSRASGTLSRLVSSGTPCILSVVVSQISTLFYVPTLTQPAFFSVKAFFYRRSGGRPSTLSAQIHVHTVSQITVCLGCPHLSSALLVIESHFVPAIDGEINRTCRGVTGTNMKLTSRRICCFSTRVGLTSLGLLRTSHDQMIMRLGVIE